jgi:hypothetical protein
MEEPKGFLGALFDFSFTAFITSRLVRFLYGLSIAGAALVSLFLIARGFNVSAGGGVFMLFIGAPLYFLLSVMFSRVLLEIVIVIFRISENTAEMARQGRAER